MTVHWVRMGVMILLCGLCMIYPFLAGGYDLLAMPLSTMVQLLGAADLLLVPIGTLWLMHEARVQHQRKRNHPQVYKGYTFASVSLITASIAAAAVSLVCLAISKALGILGLTILFYALYRLLPQLKLLREADSQRVNPVPFYLMVVPIAVLLIQLLPAAPLTEFSRKHAIAQAAEFISDIEAYHNKHGRYPITLAALYKDYYPHVVGIEKYHFAPNGESYNLFFEQPRFLFDNIGTREWVVYNPRDEHRMFSHTSWFLLLSPEELETSQGWYAVHDAQIPHWKYFWFD